MLKKLSRKKAELIQNKRKPHNGAFLLPPNHHPAAAAGTC